MLENNEEDPLPAMSQVSNVIEPHDNNIIDLVNENGLNEQSFRMTNPVEVDDDDDDDDVLFYANGLAIDDVLEDDPMCNNPMDPYFYLIQSFQELTNILTYAKR